MTKSDAPSHHFRRGIFLSLLTCLWLVTTRSVFAFDLSTPSQTIGERVGVQVRASTATAAIFEGIQAAGFSYVRFDFRWSDVEYQHGRYDWRHLDDLVAAARENHLKIIGTLYGFNDLYAPLLTLDNNAEFFGTNRISAPPTQAKAIDGFVAFATAAAQRYPQDVIWEIWNEPDTDAFWPPLSDPAAYAKMATSVCAAIKQANAQANVIGPALAKMPDVYNDREDEFILPFLQSPAAPCFDALSLHSYRLNDAPETVQDDFKTVRAYLKKHTPRTAHLLPILNGEWGYPGGPHGAEQQADYALRTHLINLLNNIPLSIWYEWQDSRLGFVDPDDVENHFGLLDAQGKPKPSGAYIADILPRIKDARILSRVALAQKDYYAIILKQPDGRAQLLAWVGLDKMNNNATLHITEPNSKKTVPLALRPQLIDLQSENIRLSVTEHPL